ncbi:MAG: SBBP repeat-containing protein [Ignavibacteriota bacterium]
MFRHFLQTLIFLFLPLTLIQSQSTFYVSVSGSNNNNGLSPQTAFATLQYAADLVSAGDSVWVKRYNGDANDIDKGIGLAVDKTGNVFVAGYSSNVMTAFDYTTIK